MLIIIIINIIIIILKQLLNGTYNLISPVTLQEVDPALKKKNTQFIKLLLKTTKSYLL